MSGAVKNSRLRKFLQGSVHTGVQILPINGPYAKNEYRQQSHKLKFRKLNASLKTLRRRNIFLAMKNTVTIRLTDEQFGWLRALSRRSKRSQSEVVRSLIEHGTVRERITRENLDIIRKLIGESTNLNQLARRANTYGFYRVADECSTAVQQISQLIKQLKDDR